MIDPKEVTAVVVTRGDVDLSEIRASLAPFRELIVWDNHLDRALYGRFLGAYAASTRLIYTQDDDCVVEWEGILRDHEPGLVTCNMPRDRRSAYQDGINLIGWGCVFERQHLAALEGYLEEFPADAIFYRQADRIFTKLNRCQLVEVPYRNLEHATLDSRMAGNSRGSIEGRANSQKHYEELKEVRRRLMGRGYAVA